VKEPDIRTWWGGLVDGMRDVSGQQYKRNRYYDPATGQFTQPDPIGIAGGLNSYGFAAGDPVSYSDPYGLCPTPEQEGIICVALLISQPSTMGLKGDNRGFSSASDPSASRAYAIINPQTREVTSHWNESCTSSGKTCSPARSDNSIAVDWDNDGSFAVTVYGNQSVYPAGPAINSGIRFYSQADGSYKTSGYADAFPSIEAYQYREDRRIPSSSGPKCPTGQEGRCGYCPSFPSSHGMTDDPTRARSHGFRGTRNGIGYRVAMGCSL
jgi:RHS repeat-associated protein